MKIISAIEEIRRYSEILRHINHCTPWLFSELNSITFKISVIFSSFLNTHNIPPAILFINGLTECPLFHSRFTLNVII